MKITSNSGSVIINLKNDLTKLKAEPGTRLAAVISLGILDQRIWSNKGSKDINGKKLTPKYSKGYIYKRKKYNRGKSTTVILSLTGDMNNQYNVVALGGDAYGLGWDGIGAYDRSGVSNQAKRNWLEALYKTTIFWLSDKEIKAVMIDVEKHVAKILG
jgi:hypothetical protein